MRPETPTMLDLISRKGPDLSEAPALAGCVHTGTSSLPTVHPLLSLGILLDARQNLGQHVSDVELAWNESYHPNSGSGSFTDSMVADSQVLLVELGLRDRGSVGDGLVIAWHGYRCSDPSTDCWLSRK